jgi:hypothetical protein
VLATAYLQDDDLVRPLQGSPRTATATATEHTKRECAAPNSRATDIMAITTSSAPLANGSGFDSDEHRHKEPFEHIHGPRPRKPQHAQLADLARTEIAQPVAAVSFLGLPTDGNTTTAVSRCFTFSSLSARARALTKAIANTHSLRPQWPLNPRSVRLARLPDLQLAAGVFFPSWAKAPAQTIERGGQGASSAAASASLLEESPVQWPTAVGVRNVYVPASYLRLVRMRRVCYRPGSPGDVRLARLPDLQLAAGVFFPSWAKAPAQTISNF